MKQLLRFLLVIPVALALGLLSSGCQILAVVQPGSAAPGDSIYVLVSCYDSNLPSNGAETDKFVLCCLVPADWTVIVSSYVAIEDNGTPVGAGLGIESQAWADSAEMVIPAPVGMKWIGLIADSAYAYDDTLLADAFVSFRVGATQGDFLLGYLMTKNAADLIDAFELGWVDTSMNHPITVGTTSVEEQRIGSAPGSYSLFQNFPNPFNPSTSIRYAVKDRDHVSLTVYDVGGRLVRTLVDGVKEPGEYLVRFTADDLPSGVYMYRLQTGSFSETRKMVLTK
jgi:hypothetical protein